MYTNGEVDNLPRISFLDTMKRNTGANDIRDLSPLMEDMDVWRNRVKSRLRPN